MENEVEVMRVVRVPPMGKLLVKVDNLRLQNISQVRDPALKQRLLTAIGELIVFADGYEALEAAGVAPPLVQKAAETGQELSPSVEQRQAEFLASLERERDVMYLTDAEVSGSEHPVGAKESDRKGDTGPLSIVGQINPLIRKHAAANPDLKGRNIELLQQPGGSLLIKVDDKYFEKPDDIDDVDVRRVIRAALKEWDSL